MRGRKQYLYHDSWTAQQSVKKYRAHSGVCRASCRAFGVGVAATLPAVDLPRTRSWPAVLRLMEMHADPRWQRAICERERIVWSDHASQIGHARVRGGHIRFRFRGKSGKWHECDIAGRCGSRTVRRCQELPGEQLLQYLDEEGNVHDITSADVNDYLHAITGREFSAKDFRTWSATSLALSQLCQQCGQPVRSRRPSARFRQ